MCSCMHVYKCLNSLRVFGVMRTPFPPTRICEETRLLAHTLHSNCEDQEINTATILLVPDLRQL